MAQYSSSKGVGLATRRLRLRLPATAASNGIGDRLRAGKPPQHFTKPPGQLSRSYPQRDGNEYQPKCVITLVDKRVGDRYNCVIPR